RLEVVNHVREGVQSLLQGERELVVYGTQESSDLPCGQEVGSAWQTDRERMQLRPVGSRVLVQVVVGRFDFPFQECSSSGDNFLGFAGGDAGNQARIQAAAQEDPIGYLGHQPLLNRFLQR